MTPHIICLKKYKCLFSILKLVAKTRKTKERARPSHLNIQPATKPLSVITDTLQVAMEVESFSKHRGR